MTRTGTLNEAGVPPSLCDWQEVDQTTNFLYSPHLDLGWTSETRRLVLTSGWSRGKGPKTEHRFYISPLVWGGRSSSVYPSPCYLIVFTLRSFCRNVTLVNLFQFISKLLINILFRRFTQYFSSQTCLCKNDLSFHHRVNVQTITIVCFLDLTILILSLNKLLE